MKECPIAAPVLQEALASRCRSEPRIGGWASASIEVELFTDADQSAVLITLLSGRGKGEASTRS